MIDLRSDTMTRPSASMRQSMATAPVGDDVFGEDPTVNELEARTARLLGHDAGLFVPSGTQSNLCGIMAHCQRGDEYLVGQNAHTYKWEGGGAAVLASVQPQPIEMAPDGTMDLEMLAGRIKPQPSLYHFATSKLLALENTHDGHPLPIEYVDAAQAVARNAGLGLHLDGARLWNAAVAQDLTPAEVAKGYDTVSVCLSKGLGAPVGSVLVGSGELVERARRWRKMLGGGMRQSGVLAAAGIYALDNNIDRLADDHRRAAALAQGLAALPGVDVARQATNMVFVDVAQPDGSAIDVTAFNQALGEQGVIVRGGPGYRLVTHLDIEEEAIATAVAGFAQVLGL